MFYKKSYPQKGGFSRRPPSRGPSRNTGKGFRTSNIDPALFIKKAVEPKNDVPYEPTLSFETLPVDKRIIELLLKKGYPKKSDRSGGRREGCGMYRKYRNREDCGVSYPAYSQLACITK